MKTERRKLSDIINGGGDIRNVWNSTSAAGDDAPLPRGEYICHVVDGALTQGRTKGTNGYKITFEVIDGPHTGRRVWHDVWFTPAALPRAKRDLAKLGVTDLEQLDEPVPPGIRCKVTVVIRTDNDKIERNEVQRFEFISLDPVTPNPYAPDDADGPEHSGSDSEIPV